MVRTNLIAVVGKVPQPWDCTQYLISAEGAVEASLLPPDQPLCDNFKDLQAPAYHLGVKVFLHLPYVRLWRRSGDLYLWRSQGAFKMIGFADEASESVIAPAQ